MRAEFLAGVENVVDPKLTTSDAKYLEDLKADLKRVQDVAYVARVDQVGVICDKFELVRLLSVQRLLIASWKELADTLYEKRANQIVTFVVRKDRVGIG